MLYLLLSPYAVFLAAGYSESLFLALALPGWLAARRGRWARRRLLVALGDVGAHHRGLPRRRPSSSSPRRQRRGRPGWTAAWLLLPPAALLGYWGYL